MTLPPPWKKALSTVASCWYSAVPASTSKLPEVPAPITGRASPVDGILRVISPLGAAACNQGLAASSPKAALARRTSRRAYMEKLPS
ncbi:hypothetical protein D3C81_1995470 [compost metagenome]